MSEQKKGLELLREPFAAHHISKKPQGTKAQNECPANEKKSCGVCGGWHHPKVIHLDYVGHAALTDRLLDADPQWFWEPLALRDGLPAFDASGGLWIKLTVCGVSRLGYGHAAASSFKEIGSREKEVIGDALRNAAMRFGAALDLWHKGELHKDDDTPVEPQKSPEQLAEESYKALVLQYEKSIDAIKNGIADKSYSAACEAWTELSEQVKAALWKAPTKGGVFTTEERTIMRSKEFRESFFGVTE